MSAGHTPGPWHVIRGGAVGTMDGFGTAVAFGDGDYEETANARLIAAAPDLLDTAKDLLAHLDLHLESMRKVVAGIPEAEESLSYIDGAMSDSLASARIVIAKATGSAD